MSADTRIGVFRKNKTEDVAITIGEFEGHRLVSIRVFADVGGDEKRPTKKGVSIRVQLLPELLRLLHNAETEALRLGYLHDAEAPSGSGRAA